MGPARAGCLMVRKLRRALDQLGSQKFQHFADFEQIIVRIRRHYGPLFPRFSENRNGSKYVYNFGVPGVQPIGLEKEHGSRDHIPRIYAKRAIQGIQDVLSFIEAHVQDDEESASEEQDNSNDYDPNSREKDPETLP